ncbi:MAG: efflux RND transporter permease subunit, partial [Candidatus Omnitrophica bacterium]|nr:efflux RND transporter permease subunit [Candidatus Omnitrophota bacterium]
TNLIFITVFLGGILAWIQIPKEEMPDITFDHVRVGVNYPGASAEEVEYYVTRPIEEAIRGLDGIYSITSSSGTGTSSVMVEIDKNYPDKNELIDEIRNAVLDVDLPEDILDDPNVMVFKTSRKAIIDIGLIYEDKNILDVGSRETLQTIALALENKLLSLPEVSAVNRSGYLDNEIHVKIDPQKLIDYRIPFNTVMKEIQDNNVRQPAGNIENLKEPKVVLSAELNSIEQLKELAIQGGFEGQVVHLKDVAEVVKGYEKTKNVLKINGHEGIFLNVVKSSSVGIIDSTDAVSRLVKDFSKNNLTNGKIKIVLLDDESFDVRNRLTLIGVNGGIGFILILICLFLFLDIRSGIWVAAGIPFTFCFALIVSILAGYTINNITLAAVIIVMGMIVDDAIVVSENITRMRSHGYSLEDAAIKGASYVFLPVIASILTTCVAFIPLWFFSGRFGIMVTFIPLIVIFILCGSLLEALLILPGHMILPLNESFNRFIHRTARLFKKERLLENHLSFNAMAQKHWFDRWEESYARFIENILSLKKYVFGAFLLLLMLSVLIAAFRMKFVMFPDEETRQINFTAEAPAGSSRYETARLSQPLEDIIAKYIGKEVVGFRTEIARTRRGSVSEENRLRMHIEILPKEKRKKSADRLIKEWQAEFASVKDISNIRFSKSWFGQSGSSPITILVKENNDAFRKKVVEELTLEMQKNPSLTNVEVDRPILNPEYNITLDRDKIRRLAINPADVARTLRAALEGKILYDFMGDDEEVFVRLTTIEAAKDDINKVLSLPVENQGQYLVPLKEIVNVEESVKPDSLNREDLKRVTTIDADIKPRAKATPLEIARYFEEKVFPGIVKKYPSTIIEFGGEVRDSRESRKDFNLAVIMAIVLIYIILVLLFNSLGKPFIIMLSIPFGVVGIILAFWLHGISLYGFFAVIGALGLSGVVVNDAIIMLTKLDKDFDQSLAKEELHKQIASIAKTRLRAVILTTLTTVAGIIPTAYGWAGYDAMLSQMMLALCWGLVFGTMITLMLIPCTYCFIMEKKLKAAVNI